jgi:hypothetical protein
MIIEDRSSRKEGREERVTLRINATVIDSESVADGGGTQIFVVNVKCLCEFVLDESRRSGQYTLF